MDAQSYGMDVIPQTDPLGDKSHLILQYSSHSLASLLTCNGLSQMHSYDFTRTLSGVSFFIKQPLIR